MKEIKQMLNFYGIQMPNQINSYTWYLLMKELAEKWSEFGEDFLKLDIKHFMNNCKCQDECCCDCKYYFTCNNKCSSRTFDCQDCPKNNF